MRKRFLQTTLAVCLGFVSCVASSAHAQQELTVTGHDKAAYMANEAQRQRQYDGPYHFSPAVRAGDFVFASGVVGGAWGANAPIDREAFKSSVRSAFNSLKDILAAAGTDLNHVVKIQTFHVFDSPLINVAKSEQVKVIAEVKDEFIAEPHPAWTAVGTTALLPDTGLVEIDIVVFAPVEK